MKTLRALSAEVPLRLVTAAGAALVSVVACAPDDTPSPPAAAHDDLRPNVLLVVLDTTRADRCGFVGYDRPTTPVLDRLAREGAAFTNAWSPAGWTGPAHASLFTGLRPENHHMWMGEDPALRQEEVTLAELLRDAGYRTAAFSCNHFVSNEFGLLQGFEKAELVLGADRAVNLLGMEAQRLAVSWIDEGRGPWFVFVNLMEPHLPYAPPWPLERQFLRPGTDPERLRELRSFDFPATIAHMLGRSPVADADLAVLSDLYDAEIAGADQAVLQLVEALFARGVLDDTIVVVAGDHGENLGEHGLVAHRFSLHRTIRHVPLLLRYPPRVDAGRVESRTVRLEDVPCTVLELCGIDPGGAADGATLLGDVGGRLSRAIHGPAPEEFRRRIGELMPGASMDVLAQGIRAVYDGRHHLIRYADGREELYDVERDPLETTDLAGSRPGVAERLREQLPTPNGR